jgi:hypothetical protein
LGLWGIRVTVQLAMLFRQLLDFVAAALEF